MIVCTYLYKDTLISLIALLLVADTTGGIVIQGIRMATIATTKEVTVIKIGSSIYPIPYRKGTDAQKGLRFSFRNHSYSYTVNGYS